MLDGQQVSLFEIGNSSGLSAAITNYGGRVVALTVPDLSGDITDIALGYEDLEGYLANPEHYIGAIVGPYANRIENSRFSLKGKSYQLDCNDGKHCLHGGPDGLYRQVWDIVDHGPQSLTLSYLSRDAEGGFPGNLEVRAEYRINGENALCILLTAKSDKSTIINLSSHIYFNLAGVETGSILSHQLQLNAGSFTPVDEHLIPTGEIREVDGTPMDFSQLRSIESVIDQRDRQLKYGAGYDHNFVVDSFESTKTRKVATVVEPTNGRTLELWSNQPGVQLYTGNHLAGAGTGKYGARLGRHSGLCLEAQNFPAAPNRKGFPNCNLEPGQIYCAEIVYRFGIGTEIRRE